MNNSTNHSITNEMKKRVPVIISLVVLAGMIAVNLAVKAPAVEPDTVHPMANAAISWDQSFHGGAWGGAE